MKNKVKTIIEIVMTCIVALLITIVLSVSGITLWFDTTFTYDIKIILVVTFISLLVFLGVIFVGRVMGISKKLYEPTGVGFANRVQEIKKLSQDTSYQNVLASPQGESDKNATGDNSAATVVIDTAKEEVPPPPPKKKYKPVFGPGADNNYKRQP